MMITRALLITTLLTGSWWPVSLAYALNINQKELDQHIERNFPFTQQASMATITFSNPRTLLDSETNTLSIGSSIEIKVPGITSLQGQADIKGQLEYRSDTKEYYLRSPKLMELQVEDMPPTMSIIIQSVVNDINNMQLPIIFFYKP